MRWDLISCNDLTTQTSTSLSEADSLFERGQTQTVDVEGGQFRFSFARLSGGRGDGMDWLEIDNGSFRTIVLPTRGMSLWKAWSKQSELGWQSPVQGPVHPSCVPIFDPSGLGWLEGFDELVVRCGLQSNGAPDFDVNGKLRYPLHGRIGNLPAHSLSIFVDPASGTLDVTGSVIEPRFLIQALKLDVRYRFNVKGSTIECTDTVTNLRSQPASMQMLYHMNFGKPLLERGAKLIAALDEIAPRNPHAAKDIDRWDTYSEPTPGYVEQVYFARPQSDARGWTTSILHNANKTRAVAIGFDTRTLPYLNLWKNTVAVEDGYVTGLEPATGFPNPRGFEEKQGRLVELAGGHSRDFTWKIESLDSAASVEQAIEKVHSLSKSACTVHREPKTGWSS